jgi:hypothetical protein
MAEHIPNSVRVRVCLAPRSQPFDEAMDSLNLAILHAQKAGFSVLLEKVRRGCPGFQNAGPTLNHFIRNGDTHLFIAADDVIFPLDAIVRLVEDDKDIVSGIYRKNMVFELSPANYVDTWQEFEDKYRAGGLYETKFAACHSLTVKRHVIEKMMEDYPELAYEQGDEKHYALFIPMIHEGKCYQDDWAFSIRAQQSGFKLWDDYNCKLKHYCYEFMGFEALDAKIAQEAKDGN